MKARTIVLVFLFEELLLIQGGDSSTVKGGQLFGTP